MTRARVGMLAVAAVVALIGAVAAQATGRVFYLALRSHECGVVASPSAHVTATKYVRVLPCSDPSHNFEVYAVRHGGWGHRTEPAYATVTVRARQICLNAFQQVTGRPMRAPFGYIWFAPDPGREEARYGDKLICSLVHYPQMTPLGPGWHA